MGRERGKETGLSGGGTSEHGGGGWASGGMDAGGIPSLVFSLSKGTEKRDSF